MSHKSLKPCHMIAERLFRLQHPIRPCIRSWRSSRFSPLRGSKPCSRKATQRGGAPWTCCPDFVTLVFLLALGERTSLRIAHEPHDYIILAYAGFDTCETVTCDTNIPTCDAQPPRPNCSLKQPKMVFKQILERIKRFHSSSREAAQMLS